MSTGKYLLRKLGLFFFTLGCVLTILFFLFKLMPGDPTAIFLDNNLSLEMIARQRQLWGLNDPLWQQYLHYIANMVTFRFGNSFFGNESVSDIMVEKTRTPA